jgi:arylsulfatase A-like enzyme
MLGPEASENHQMRLPTNHIASLATGLLCSSLAFAAPQPNIVLILADDLGFTDIAPYGSEIKTPTLSKLANEGIAFTNYHTAASCAPSRAMLLTGVDSHRNGVPNIPEAIPPEQKIHANYQGTLGHNVVTVATLLGNAGYHTYMAGKWHLGRTPELLPGHRGFERSVAMADTGSDNWEQKPYIPIYEKANWFEDDIETNLPADFYSSRFLVDKTIEYIDSNLADAKPFFVYLPFQAVHIPVQAPQEFTDKYMGVYDQGWSKLRKQRRVKAIELGIIGPDTPMLAMHTTDDWDSLSTDQRRYQSKRMAVYSGMVEAMDFHIGRLVEYLKTTQQLDNTIFIFTSDNGSEPGGDPDPESAGVRFFLGLMDYDTDYDNLGLKGSWNSLGPSFASAAASPLAYYKFYAGEGGLRVPLIISGEPLAVAKPITNAFSYVTDITPTILELAGVTAASANGAEAKDSVKLESIIGRSLLPLVSAEKSRVYSSEDTIGYEIGGNAALFQGDYKITYNRGPVGDNQWHLFNIAKDPGETNDLATAMPEKFASMQQHYHQYMQANGVLPVPEGYDQIRQVFVNGMLKRFGTQLSIAAAVLFLMLALGITALVRRIRRT